MEVLSRHFVPSRSDDESDFYERKKNAEMHRYRRSTERQLLNSLVEVLKECGTTLPCRLQREILVTTLFMVSELKRKGEILEYLLTKEVARNQSLKERLFYLRQRGETTSSESPLAELEATAPGIQIKEEEEDGPISKCADTFEMEGEDFLRKELIEMESRTPDQEMQAAENFRRKLMEGEEKKMETKKWNQIKNQNERNAGIFERRSREELFFRHLLEVLEGYGTCVRGQGRRKFLYNALLKISELQSKSKILKSLLTKKAARYPSLRKHLQAIARQRGETMSSESPLAELEPTDPGITITLTEEEDGGWISQHAEKFGTKEEDYVRNQLIEMESRTLAEEMESLQKLWRRKLKESKRKMKKKKKSKRRSNEIELYAGALESMQDMEQEAAHGENCDGEEGDGWILESADEVKVKEEANQESEAVHPADVMHPVSMATNLFGVGESYAVHTEKEEEVEEEEGDDCTPIPCLLCSQVFQNVEGLKHHLPTHVPKAPGNFETSTSERAPGGEANNGEGRTTGEATGQQKSTAGQQKDRPKEERDEVQSPGGFVFCCTRFNDHCQKFFKSHALTRASHWFWKASYCCNTCQKFFMTVKALLDHVYEKHPFICTQCQTSSSLDGLVTAEEVRSLKSWQECFQDLWKGIPSHEHAYYCRYYTFHFEESKHIRGHIESNHQGSPSDPADVAMQKTDLFRCRLCSRDMDIQTSTGGSTEGSKLKASRPQESPPKKEKKESPTSCEGKLSCRRNLEPSESVYALKGAANQDALKRREFCPLCLLHLANKGSLTRHLRTVHKQVPENYIFGCLCYICGRCVTGLLSLQEHIREAHPSHALLDS